MKSEGIRLLPEQATEENISSREFLKKAEFVLIDSLLPKDDGNGGGNGGSTTPPDDGPTNPGTDGD